MTIQQYCLRWNNHQPNFISVFSSLLSSQSLVDVTLAAEGKHLQAHKVVLSACSSYFQSLFTINPCKHPIVILKDVKFNDLKVMVDFMYHGEVNVSQEQLPCILKTAEMLKIKGLTDIPVDQSASRCENRPPEKTEMTTLEDNWSVDENNRITSPASPSSRRKRLKKNMTCSTGSETEQTNEILLSTVESVNVIGSVLKTEPDRYQTDNTQTVTTPQKCNGIPVSSIQPGPSHEITEPEATHHISLQVTSHDVNPPHTIDCSAVEIPRTSVAQQTTTGIQWNVLDQSGYTHYSSTPGMVSTNVGTTTTTTQFTHPAPTNEPLNPQPPPPPPPQPNHSNNTLLIGSNQNVDSTAPYGQVPKRKRSINPQGDENFIRALDAVRFGGIGFCKAARMYGVNNRTLWLEYKKRGYPNFRLSIKNRNQAQGDLKKANSPANIPEQNENPNERQVENKTMPCAITYPIVISGTVYEGKQDEFKHMLQRSKYYETPDNQAQTIQFQSIQLEQM